MYSSILPFDLIEHRVADGGGDVASPCLRLANQIYDEVKRHFQELVFKTIIQRNVKLSEAPSHGIPAILYDADSTGAKNHLALANEIINKN